MKEQIFLSGTEKIAALEKKAVECWRNRFTETLEKQDYTTQSEFIKEIEKRYKTNFTQAMISDWQHVGEIRKKKDGTERRIGFPLYTNMLLIADCLNVDVGYLTGETDMETFTIEKVSDYTNLSEEAINSILKITGSRRSYVNLGGEAEKYKKILNKLLSTPKFIEFIKALGDLDDVYAEKANTQQPLKMLQEELGDERFDLASKYSAFGPKELEDLNLTEEEVNAILLFQDAIDKCDSLEQKNEYDIKAYRYNVQETLTILMEQLYSDKK